jgi:hypothetical protein
MPPEGQAPENLEQMNFRSTGVGIGAVLPIDQEDVHEPGGLTR